MNYVWHALSKLTGKNSKLTPASVIQSQLQEKRPLPTGVTEFHEWADRIISGALLTATPESQKFALANTLINLGPTVAYETDHYFISVLRKHAVNQVADAMRNQLREEVKARLAAEENAQILAKTGV